MVWINRYQRLKQNHTFREYIKLLFDERVERRGVEDCWPWQGVIFRNGYGCLTATIPSGKVRAFLAHRLSYYFAYGKFNTRLFVCHHCDNPKCVNPEHLFLGTPQDNMDDKVQKGRQPRGENAGNAKLTETQIGTVFELYAADWTQQQIANHIGCSFQHVSKILRRQRRAFDRVREAEAQKVGQTLEKASRGERKGSAKITEQDVLKIFDMFEVGASTAQISEDIGIGIDQVGRILRRKDWSHVHISAERAEKVKGLLQGSRLGENNSQSRLTEEKVKESRELRERGMSVKQIADYFEVSPPTIYRALRGETWGHVSSLNNLLGEAS